MEVFSVQCSVHHGIRFTFNNCSPDWRRRWWCWVTSRSHSGVLLTTVLWVPAAGQDQSVCQCQSCRTELPTPPPPTPPTSNTPWRTSSPASSALLSVSQLWCGTKTLEVRRVIYKECCWRCDQEDCWWWTWPGEAGTTSGPWRTPPGPGIGRTPAWWTLALLGLSRDHILFVSSEKVESLLYTILSREISPLLMLEFPQSRNFFVLGGKKCVSYRFLDC